VAANRLLAAQTTQNFARGAAQNKWTPLTAANTGPQSRWVYGHSGRGNGKQQLPSSDTQMNVRSCGEQVQKMAAKNMDFQSLFLF